MDLSGPGGGTRSCRELLERSVVSPTPGSQSATAVSPAGGAPHGADAGGLWDRGADPAGGREALAAACLSSGAERFAQGVQRGRLSPNDGQLSALSGERLLKSRLGPDLSIGSCGLMRSMNARPAWT